MVNQRVRLGKLTCKRSHDVHDNQVDKRLIESLISKECARQKKTSAMEVCPESDYVT